MNRKAIFQWVKKTYGTEPDYPWNDKNAVLRHKDNRKWYGIVLEAKRETLGLETGEGDSDLVEVLNVKSDPDLIGSLREKKGFLPAYHMNKENWISILLEDSVSEEEVKNLIRLSYQLTESKKIEKKQTKTNRNEIKRNQVETGRYET